MATVIFDVASEADFDASVEAAFRGEQQEPRISFASAELLFSIMTAKRWEVVRAMTGAGPLSIREVARRVGRDVKGVHGDVQALLKCGVLDKDSTGRVVFPFDAIHVDFMIEAAA
jgi:predicted transcriptional regulator